MVFPNFLIIGAAKAGTTALHSYLQQHPQIYMTPEKETNFFAFEGKKLNFQGTGDEAINKFSITDIINYEKVFNQVKNEIAVGEACPLYLYSPEAAAKIKTYLPNVKLVIILRHPVSRAYANFLHLVRDDREPNKDFFQALQLESQRIKDNWEWFWHYIQLGFYAQQLKRYYELFSSEQIQVYLYDDFLVEPIKIIQNIFDFVQVDKTFLPDLSIRPNKSGMPKNLLLHRFLTKPNPIKTLLKPLFPTSVRQKIQHQNLVTPEICLASQKLLLDLYREDILECQDLIGRKLSNWLK
ncbi:sulfotransferase family protein [Gloeothece verrucosa]|uniref:Sulfotransferase n=1 Tax=Gloeothece verrucosa (strain PCC 7822) TaxID=497965 RepID=E0UD46_GLOV7|nr:sulfotransferase [Gloeothece verrucosa]ADN12926.1 sulfotransferase [Gloeothece verrucosa PCC 7822]